MKARTVYIYLLTLLGFGFLCAMYFFRTVISDGTDQSSIGNDPVESVTIDKEFPLPIPLTDITNESRAQDDRLFFTELEFLHHDRLGHAVELLTSSWEKVDEAARKYESEEISGFEYARIYSECEFGALLELADYLSKKEMIDFMRRLESPFNSFSEIFPEASERVAQSYLDYIVARSDPDLGSDEIAEAENSLFLEAESAVPGHGREVLSLVIDPGFASVKGILSEFGTPMADSLAVQAERLALAARESSLREEGILTEEEIAGELLIYRRKAWEEVKKRLGDGVANAIRETPLGREFNDSIP
jgi:hypothetical protein